MTAPVVDPGEPQPVFADDLVTVYQGDCLDVLRQLGDASVDAVCTDPPYGIRFMGQAWDGADIERGVKARRAQAAMPVDGKAGANGGYRSAAAEAGRYDLSTSANQAFQDWCLLWAVECLRILKPGGHLLAFGGSRTWHRLAAAVEDAGFEIRDSIAWLYGSGFPKSLDVSKAIDKATGAERQVIGRKTLPTGEARREEGPNTRADDSGWARPWQSDPQAIEAKAQITAPATDDAQRWQGWGTALKPAFEPIVVGRKPLAGTVAANVLEHGTGALNIDACRIEGDVPTTTQGGQRSSGGLMNATGGERGTTFTPHVAGRWPANVVLDESQAADLDAQSGIRSAGSSVAGTEPSRTGESGIYGHHDRVPFVGHGDSGGASRFFPTFHYEAKAPTAERPRGEDGATHPTVKPLDLMRWLIRLVTPPDGVVLDPFLGSGTTAEACVVEGFHCIGIERDPEYVRLAVARLSKPIEPVLFGDPA